MRGFAGRQHGAILLVTLIMLVILTLFAVSMIRLSGTNVKAVGNMQIRGALEASAQQAIEKSIGSSNFYNDVINSTGPWAGAATTSAQTVNGYAVTVTKPTCLYAQTAAGYSAVSGVAPQDTYWEQDATVTDNQTGAAADLLQGVKITLPQGNCPP
jgi:Tfp pilus assembly protein PilX